MIYNTISCKAILGKIYRDLKPNMSGWEADAVEWIGEALDFIGYHAAFIKKTKALAIKDFRSPLPADFYNLIGIYYNGIKLPYGSNLTSEGQYLDDTYISAKTEVLESSNSGMTRYGSRLYNTTGNSDTDYYILNPNYIITSFETGKIQLKYNAWPTDKDGLPNVPDNIYYKQALEWYVIRQLIMGGYKHPIFSYEFADMKWQHYCIAAQNDVAMPTPDQAERFRNMWVRMIPDHNLDLNTLIDTDTHE